MQYVAKITVLRSSSMPSCSDQTQSNPEKQSMRSSETCRAAARTKCGAKYYKSKDLGSTKRREGSAKYILCVLTADEQLISY